MGDKFSALMGALPMVTDGFIITMKVTIGGAIVAIALAVVLGLLARMKTLWIRGPVRFIIEFFRGTSLVVQLFWVYYVLPVLTGVKLEAVMVAIVALGLNYGAYGAEVVRGSINSVATGQWEATLALSMGRYKRIFRVIFPQAWALMLPSLNNLLIQLLKGSAAVSFIAMTDLNWSLTKLRLETGTFFAYAAGLLLYYVIAYVLAFGMNALEVRAKHRLGQGPPLSQAWGFKSPQVSTKVGAQ